MLQQLKGYKINPYKISGYVWGQDTVTVSSLDHFSTCFADVASRDFTDDLFVV